MDEQTRVKLWLSTIVHNKSGRFTITELWEEMNGLGFAVSKDQIKAYMSSVVGTVTSKGKLIEVE